MKFAVISDIHSNIPALTVALEDIKAQGCEKLICLGDVIGYGPHPTECTQLIMKHCDVVICGNHDEALKMGGLGFNGRARRAIDWTQEQLKPGFFSGLTVRRRWEFLTTLPMFHKEGKDLFIHGSPRDYTSEYVLPNDAQFGETPKLKEIFEQVEWRLFLGHTHLPMILTDDYECISPDKVDNEWDCDPDQKVIINIGSVGQPRDKDNRLSYVVVDGNKVTWRRLEYDYMKTVEAIKKIDKLDASLGERLITGT